MDKSRIDPPNKPYSPVAYTLPDAYGNDVQMIAYWSPDGKRPMPDAVHFLSILHNVDKVEANKKLPQIKTHCLMFKGNYFIEIAKLKELLQHNKIPRTPSKFSKSEAEVFRNRIIASFDAFEKGDSSMVILNTMNRQAALTSASVSNTPTVPGASSVSGASSSPVEEMMPRPLRQKKVATMPTFPITSVQASCNGASPSIALSAASAASAMQVRLLV